LFATWPHQHGSHTNLLAQGMLWLVTPSQISLYVMLIVGVLYQLLASLACLVSRRKISKAARDRLSCVTSINPTVVSNMGGLSGVCDSSRFENLPKTLWSQHPLYKLSLVAFPFCLLFSLLFGCIYLTTQNLFKLMICAINTLHCD